MTLEPLMSVIVERGLTRYVTAIEEDEVDVGDVEEAAEEADEVAMTTVAVVAAQETELGIQDGEIEVVDLAV